MRVLFAAPDPDLVMRNSGDDRKEGLHLSDITKRMAFEKDKKLNPENPMDAMVLERGYNWERVLELALSDRHVRAGERPDQMQEDGIWMSPDWVDPTADIQLEEWKATKKTTKRSFDDVSWHWMPNTMSYLRALLKRGICKVLRARFRIWYMNGDYSYESKSSDLHLFSDYWRVDVEYDKRELEENWRKILQAGRRYGLLKQARREGIIDDADLALSKQKDKEPCQAPRKPLRRNDSKPPVKSRGRVLTGTFQSTKRS